VDGGRNRAHSAARRRPTPSARHETATEHPQEGNGATEQAAHLQLQLRAQRRLGDGHEELAVLPRLRALDDAEALEELHRVVLGELEAVRDDAGMHALQRGGQWRGGARAGESKQQHGEG
jgi:hypothetical protein